MNISIVIPNYNGAHFLEACLKSLNEQTLKPSEIILVDNGSKDESIKWIKTNYPEIILIELDQNYGFSRAVNEGIKVSKSEFVALLNNDTELEATWLEELIKPMLVNDSVFSCSSKMVQYHNRNLIDDAGDQYNILGWAYKRGDNKSIKRFDEDSNIFSSCAGAALYRKSVFDEIGYFDETFFAYLEDVDISFRALRYGYENVYCSKAIVYHIGSGTSGSKYNDFKVELAAKNNLLLIVKNMNIFLIVVNGIFLLAGILIKFLFFTLKGFRKAYVEGLLLGFKHTKEYKKTKPQFNSFKTMCKIEIWMIKNTFEYVFSKVQ